AAAPFDLTTRLARSHALVPEKPLRVADPRSGARLCGAQHCPQFSRGLLPIWALAVGKAAAGRRLAVRDLSDRHVGLHRTVSLFLTRFVGCITIASKPSVPFLVVLRSPSPRGQTHLCV